MARYHYWQYIVDEEGSPLDSVDISFYLSDQPTVFANIFLNPTTGAITTTEQAGLKTDANGFFEFWVGDPWEVEGGYEHSQKFRLEWYKAGIIAGAIDPVDIFPPLPSVDETASGQAIGEREKKNKLISNALAYKWNQHIDLPVPSASPHDIQPVVFCDTDNEFNKVVSNRLINKMYQGALSAGDVTLDSSVADMFTSSISASDLLLITNPLSGDVGNFILTNPPSSSKNIRHELQNEWPVVQVMKLPQGEVIVPTTVKSISDRRTVIEVAQISNYRVTIIG
jgi:hypothetical protein